MPTFVDDDARMLYRELQVQAEKKRATARNTTDTRPGIDELVLHVADGCNLACTYCFSAGGTYGDSKQRWMSTTVARESIEATAKKYGHINTVKFFGGEPLLNFGAIVESVETFHRLVDNGQLRSMPKFGIVTNLTRLTPEIVDLLVSEQVRTTVSIDGPKEIHDASRVYGFGGGSYDTVVNNFRNLAASGGTVAVEIVYSPAHMRAKETMISVYDFTWESLHPAGLVMGILGQTPETAGTAEWNQFRSHVHEVAYDLGRYFVNTLDRDPSARQVRRQIERSSHLGSDDSFCGAGRDTITVDSQGIRWPCYFFKTAQTSPPPDGRRLLPIIASQIQTPKSSIPECRTCDFISTCHQCPGILKQATGRPDQPIDIECTFSSRLLEGVLGELSRAYKVGGDTWASVARAIRGIN